MPSTRFREAALKGWRLICFLGVNLPAADLFVIVHMKLISHLPHLLRSASASILRTTYPSAEWAIHLSGRLP